MLKNKIIVRKIRNIIILLMVIAIMVGAYKNIDRSRAEEVVPIDAIALDSAGYLEEEEFILEAKEIEEDKYEIKLPESINTKKVNQIVKVSLEDFENEEKSEETTTTETATEEDSTVEIVENKIYLTGEEIDSKEINLEVEYDVVITEDTTLYSKILKYEDEENGKQVELKGYLPVEAELQVKELTQEEIAKAFGDRKMQVAYDIKILQKVVTTIPADEANPESKPEEIVETIEINPEDFGEFCEVTITDKEIKENSKVLHVKKDNTLEEVKVKETTDGNISFEAETFSIYGFEEPVVASEEGESGEVGQESNTNVQSETGTTGIVQEGLIRNFDAKNNTGNGHSNSTTTWKDLSGNNNGTISGATWTDEYLSFDGSNDWVNLGQVSLSNAVTLEATIELNEIQSGTRTIIANYESGGLGLELVDGVPVFSVYISSAYRLIKDTEALIPHQKYHIVGTYDGTIVKLYVNGELKAETAYSGTIGAPTNSTVMAIGANPGGSSVTGQYANINVYTARTYNVVLTRNQITNNALNDLGVIEIDNKKPEIYLSTDVITDGLIREFDAYNNTGNGHDSSVTTWKDLTGTNNGTITGATWSDEYLSFDGTNDWVNLGQVSLTNAVTLETTIETNEIQSGNRILLANCESGGVSLNLKNGVPEFRSVCIVCI